MGLTPALTPVALYDYVRMYRLRVIDARRVRAKGKAYDATLLFRHKLYMNAVLRYADLPVCEDLGLIEAGKVRTLDGEAVDFADRLQAGGGELFIKPVMGSGGRECALIRRRDDPRMAAYLAARGPYLLQRPLVQHAAMNMLYPGAINTVRMVTIAHGERAPRVFCAVLRIGCDGAGVDNWTSGGLVANLDIDTGRVASSGRRKRPFVTIVHHPDTGLCLKGFEVPCLQRMADVASRAHRLFPFAPSLGWDLACTVAGVVILEVNHDWGANIHRLFDRDFDRRFLSALRGS